MSIEPPTEPDYVSADYDHGPLKTVKVYTTEQARMRLREVLATAEWPQDGTAEEYFIREVFPDPPSAPPDAQVGGLEDLTEWLKRQVKSTQRQRERQGSADARYLSGIEGAYEYVLTRIDLMEEP